MTCDVSPVAMFFVTEEENRMSGLFLLDLSYYPISLISHIFPTSLISHIFHMKKKL